MSTKPCTDVELRLMRDTLYPSIPDCYQTHERWLMVIDNWRQDYPWLANEYAKVKAKETRAARSIKPKL